MTREGYWRLRLYLGRCLRRSSSCHSLIKHHGQRGYAQSSGRRTSNLTSSPLSSSWLQSVSPGSTSNLFRSFLALERLLWACQSYLAATSRWLSCQPASYNGFYCRCHSSGRWHCLSSWSRTCDSHARIVRSHTSSLPCLSQRFHRTCGPHGILDGLRGSRLPAKERAATSSHRRRGCYVSQHSVVYFD